VNLAPVIILLDGAVIPLNSIATGVPPLGGWGEKRLAVIVSALAVAVAIIRAIVIEAGETMRYLLENISTSVS